VQNLSLAWFIEIKLWIREILVSRNLKYDCNHWCSTHLIRAAYC